MENEVVAPDTAEVPAPEAPAVAPAEPQSRADTIREALAKHFVGSEVIDIEI